MKMEKMAELYYCEVDQENGGVFLTESLDADYCFPLYGVYKRSPGDMEENQITSVLLRPMAGERKPYYMRVSDQCPWRYVRAPRDGEVANCVIRENQCAMHDLAKVVLALTERIYVGDNGPVELLCVYDLKKLADGWKQANVPRSAKRRNDGLKLKGRQRKKRPTPPQSSASAASEEEDQEDAEQDDDEDESFEPPSQDGDDDYEDYN